MTQAASPLLTVRDLNVYYGAIHAIKGISLEVYEDATLLTLENAPHGFTGDFDKKARRSMHSYMKSYHSRPSRLA